MAARRPGTEEPLLLGIDLGTSVLKVLAVTTGGRIVGQGSGEYPIERPGPDRAEQDPDAWWVALGRAVSAALDGVAETCGIRRADAGNRIAAIGLAGQMHGAVLLGADGHPLGPAVIWPDQRSALEVRTLTTAVGAKRVIEVAGGPLATGFQAASLAWIRRHEPDRWAQLRIVLAPKDALRLRLTGEVATDASDASGTGLFDVAARTWSRLLLDAVGLDERQLPPLRGAAERAGRLSPAAAAALGLKPGTCVAVGAADTAAGLLGAAITRPDALLLTLSSGGQLAVPADRPAIDAGGRSHTLCTHAPPSSENAGWYRLAAILSAGLALRWLRDAVFSLPGPGAYERMIEWAAEVPAGANGLIFVPYLAGERTPHMDPTARGLFVGLTARHGRGELVRAVLEGVALACYDASRVLAEEGSLPDRLILGGGGGRSRLWQQIVSDVFGSSSRRLEVDEQAALGACLLAGEASGLLLASGEARAWARLGEPIEPDLTTTLRYGELFRIFRSAYVAHRDDFAALRALEGT